MAVTGLQVSSVADTVHRDVETLIDVLTSQGASQELAMVLLRETTASLTRREPRGGGLSEAQAHYLIESGAFTAAELDATEREVAAGRLAEDERQTRLGALARTLSAAEVAARLGIEESAVRHRQRKNLLFAFLSGGKRRYPTWQFVEGTNRVVPHLAPVVEAFPREWHPATIEGFMMTPKSGLRLDGRESSPVEWLLQDGDPEPVTNSLVSFLMT